MTIQIEAEASISDRICPIKEGSLRGKDFCRGCNSQELFKALDLGYSPFANNLIRFEELESAIPWFPLVLRVCRNCALGQLGEFNSSFEIFHNYSYLSSTSTTWLESNKLFAQSMFDVLNLTKESLVLEIASNDGYLLQYFKDLGVGIFGIEPALNVATIASLKGIPTSSEFFSEHLAIKLIKHFVAPRLIVAKNVVAHVPDLQDFLRGIQILANDETLIVFEAPSILGILNRMQFDTIYHEHFSYLSATFLKNVLHRFDMNLIGTENVETHGGAVRFYISKKTSNIEVSDLFKQSLNDTLEEENLANLLDELTWKNFSGRVFEQLENFRTWIRSLNRPIVGYGAAAKTVTLLSAAQIPRGSILCCVDNADTKIDLFIPGHQIPIVSEVDFLARYKNKDLIFIIFPWNLKQEISARIKNLAPKAQIFVGLPIIEEV